MNVKPQWTQPGQCCMWCSCMVSVLVLAAFCPSLFSSRETGWEKKYVFPQSFLWWPTLGNLLIVFPGDQLSISKHTPKHSTWGWTKDLGFLKVVLVGQRCHNCCHMQPPLPWMCPSALDTLHFHFCYRRCLELSHRPRAALSGTVQHQTSASIQQESRKELFLQASWTT